jgi:flagellar export protein FliJ
MEVTDRLAPIVSFKASREDAAARELAEALQAKVDQEALVENERKRVAAARPKNLHNAALATLVDIADDRKRDELRAAEEKLAVVDSVVADVRDTHRQASLERQVLERVRHRRRLEHGTELARKERRSFDVIAARRYH